MTQTIKLRIINELVEELSYISPVTLEYLADNVISFLESKRLIHRGVNLKDRPVKSSVDVYSEHSKIVVECSTQEDYFISSGRKTKEFMKIKTDVEKAINHLPPNGPDIIYLISSQVQPPSFQKAFNNTETFKQHGERIKLYDASVLANLIYEQTLTNSDIFDFFRECLPQFALNMDNYEYYGKVPPPCKNHIVDHNNVDAIARHFEREESICVLFGLSGAGKTQTTIQFVHSNGNKYENVLWLNGEDWKPDTPFSSIQRTRGGSPINVSGIFNKYKTLLVIDNLARFIDETIKEELRKGIELGGNILVTSQSGKQDKSYLEIKSCSPEVAIQILGENEESISEEGLKVIEICSTVPIILSMINDLAERENIPRNQLYQDVLTNPNSVTDDNGKSIIKSILSKLEEDLYENFKKIANSGSSYHDSQFLDQYIGILVRLNLKKLSFLSPTNTPGILKAHDLLLNSVRDVDSFEEITGGIESYLDKHKGKMTPGILREIHLCYNQLCAENDRRGKRTPDWITYALIQIEGDLREFICQNIHFSKLEKELPLSAIMSIIDAKERYAYTLTGEARADFYKKCLEEYQTAHKCSTDDDISFEYLHHIGKTQIRCKQYFEALRTFNLIIESRPESYPALGQIVKLGAKHDVPSEVKLAGVQAIKKLLDFICNDEFNVPLRVALATIAHLRSYKSVQNEISKNAEIIRKLSEVISTSALEGFGQFFDAYIAFTSMFGNEYSDFVIDFADQFFAIIFQTPKTVHPSRWLSACEGLVNTAKIAGENDRKDLFKKLKEPALQFVTEISKRNALEKYEVRALAKAYNIFEEPQNALEIIEKLSEEEMNHWVQYQRAKAKYLLNDYTSAEIDANEALQNALSDEKARNMLSSYHDLYSQCLEKNGNLEDAIKELENAIEKTDGKYKTTLEQRKLKLVKSYDQSLNI